MSSKVLVVDDSGVMRKIIVRSLNVVGVTDIVEAEDGEQAFAAFQAEPFDLVLTDWNMPVRDARRGLRPINAVCTLLSRLIGTTKPVLEHLFCALRLHVRPLHRSLHHRAHRTRS